MLIAFEAIGFSVVEEFIVVPRHDDFVGSLIITFHSATPVCDKKPKKSKKFDIVNSLS